jgi:single-strand DNA-binding protein
MLNTHVNKVILVGEVETDKLTAQLTRNQGLVTHFKLKTQLQIRTGNGSLVEETEIHVVTAWGDLARLCLNHLQAGTLLYLEGRLYSSRANRRSEIVAEQIRLLKASDREGQANAESATEEEAGLLFSDRPLTSNVRPLRA